MKKNHLVIEVIGWYGMLAILSAYALVSLQIIGSTDLVYQSLNITGAIGLIVHSYVKKDLQPIILNFIWVLIALFGIFSVL